MSNKEGFEIGDIVQIKDTESIRKSEKRHGAALSGKQFEIVAWSSNTVRAIGYLEPGHRVMIKLADLEKVNSGH